MDDASIIAIVGIIVGAAITLLIYGLQRRDKRLEADKVEDKKVKSFDVIVDQKRWTAFQGITETVQVKTAEEIHIVVRGIFATEVIYSINHKGSNTSFAQVEGKRYFRRREAVIKLDPYKEYTLTIQITPRFIIPTWIWYRIIRKQPSVYLVGTLDDMFASRPDIFGLDEFLNRPK